MQDHNLVSALPEQTSAINEDSRLVLEDATVESLLNCVQFSSHEMQKELEGGRWVRQFWGKMRKLFEEARRGEEKFVEKNYGGKEV